MSRIIIAVLITLITLLSAYAILQYGLEFEGVNR